jgi:hypothetical protein
VRSDEAENPDAMGIGAFAEPLVVVTLLFGGAYFNRRTGGGSAALLGAYSPLEPGRKRSDDYERGKDSTDEGSLGWSGSSSGLVSPAGEQSRWRNRRVKFFRYSRLVQTPNTTAFQDRLLSRLLQKFPFLVEAWYWALIYWVCIHASRATMARADTRRKERRTC